MTQISVRDLYSLTPELIMTVAGLLILLIDLAIKKKEFLAVLTIVASAVAFYTLRYTYGSTFNGQFHSDQFSNYFKFIFLLNLALTVLISVKYIKMEDANYGEYYALLVFATVGMMFMASSGSLIVLYLGLELMALSTYVLVGIFRTKTKSTEAALKYFLLGALSSAILLYGMSLVYGATGSLDLMGIQRNLAKDDASNNYMLIIGILMILTAFSFKIAAVPFHMWAPDVYEGAPTSITAFMSVGPKAAAFAIMIKVLLIAFPSVHEYWTLIVVVLATITMLVGNVLALVQTNIKRMLAYSSIAHAGYILLGVLPGTSDSVAAVLNYLLIYMFMNIGAFSLVIMLKGEGAIGENISDFQGLAKSHPFSSALMLIFLFSLTGIPPMAGFIGKFYIFTSLIYANYLWLAVAGLMFSVISAFYYLRIVMLMYMREPEREIVLSNAPALSIAATVCAIMVVFIGVAPQAFVEYARFLTSM